MRNDKKTITTSLSSASTPNSRYAILIISLCACFLFYKYVLQIYPGIITQQLMIEFHLTGAGLGNLAATFYYTYMIAQLFVGVLLDRYNVRLLTSFAIASCALGIFIFAHAHTLIIAELARMLMGVGVAFATVAYMKLAAEWFPPRQYAFIGGLLATAAMAGAVFGQTPLALLINVLGWRDCLQYVGLAGFILAIVFLLVVRDRPNNTQTLSTAKHNNASLTDILKVLKSKQNWLLTLYSGLVFSPIAIFGGLWGNPFLQAAYHIDKTTAASFVSLVFIGLGLGSPLLGMLSDRLGDRRNVMLYSTLVACIAIFLVLYWPNLPEWLLAVFLFVFGFAVGAFMLAFAIGKELNNIALTATVIAMINASDAVLDAITEPTIGKFLDWSWQGKIVHGIHYFSLHSYRLALTILPVYLLVGALLLLFIKMPSYKNKY